MLEQVSSTKVFGGWLRQFNHQSEVNNCSMRFAIYLPPQAATQKVPVLYWLSGLTCTDENVMQKSGIQRVAAELGIAIVAPDTSPRGDDVADDPDASYDFGLGAGFYVNANQAPFKSNYQMYSYIVDELPALIEAKFNVNQTRSISGHSMGGHGAITIGLKNSLRYQSISAFSPICNPINCPWGQKAFNGYLGADQTSWAEYDSCELIKKTDAKIPMLVDQGNADNFLTEQLQSESLKTAANINQYPLTLRMQEGYDHSYYFISSFIEEHLRFHAKYLIK
ncbi:S-formylglutathione hydrolase [Shewanella sp. FYR11-62]|uniref:S-formylglutathione hydrolase n=2 Tax=Shewanella subflava TaxID=2986476 RepID=A0ABT3IAK9_9GAMM|nr:S-formylglutathione hydrolase [Shewanella subflava]